MSYHIDPATGHVILSRAYTASDGSPSFDLTQHIKDIVKEALAERGFHSLCPQCGGPRHQMRMQDARVTAKCSSCGMFYVAPVTVGP